MSTDPADPNGLSRFAGRRSADGVGGRSYRWRFGRAVTAAPGWAQWCVTVRAAQGSSPPQVPLADMSLWTWRNTIITKGVHGQRKNGAIYVVEVTGEQRAALSIANARPIALSVNKPARWPGRAAPARTPEMTPEKRLHRGCRRT